MGAAQFEERLRRVDDPPPLNGRIGILLPVLNEAANIGALWTRIARTLSSHAFTVCFVDDGSADGTVDFIENLCRRDPARCHLIRRRKMMRGSQRGSALFAALQWAVSQEDIQYVVEMDGDLSHRPEEIGRGLRLIASGEWDVAIASKYLPGSSVINRPATRRAVSFVCNSAVRWLLSPAITDYINGFRFYTREAALAVAGARIRYGSPVYLSEVVAIWLHDRFRVTEFESSYVGRNEGLSKLRPLDLIKAAFAVCEIAWRFHTGRFATLATRDSAARPSPPAETSLSRR